MDNRELRATTQRRLTALRAAVQRGAELVTETEARLQATIDEANRKAVAVLREFEDLADGGRWPGGRHAIFEAPRFCRPSADRTRRHQALMAGIGKQVQQALRLLDPQQATLLRAPDLARVFVARSIPTIDAGLVPTECLRGIEAQFNADAQKQGGRAV